MNSDSIIKTQNFTFAAPPNELLLECGKKIGPVTVAYETYGTLNEQKDNAILICHALSGDAHVAGRHKPDDKKPGWWDEMVGDGKGFDTLKYFVICSNVLGGCKGTTGPASINPKTNKPYGTSFPIVTISDMVNVQAKLIEHLGIKTLLCVAGGSMGGMQAMEWAISHPEKVKSAMIIASTSRLSPQAIAFDTVGRNAITSDAAWENGNYYEKGKQPERGLAIARMIGHITYLSDKSMHQKFGRTLIESKGEYKYDFAHEFEVESYLEYKGATFVERFDANSYLYITKAIDYYDLSQKYGSLKKAFESVQCKSLVVSFTSDWLYPPYQSKEIVKALLDNDKPVTYCEIESSYGHDAFLLEFEHMKKIIKSFLSAI